jgi:prepilin-type N-terminal cleavage/methylation domain-containing protein
MKIMKIKREKGFTLIEVIVVLVLLGIMGAFLATTVVRAVEGFMFTRDSAIKSQKAQLALARIERELLDITSIDSAPTSDTVAYTTSYGQFQLTKAGNQITITKTGTSPISAQTLIGDVLTTYDSGVFLSFTKQDGTTWSYADYQAAVAGTGNISDLSYIIKVIIKLNGYGGVTTLTFETTVNPRNNKLANAPILY